MDYSQLDKVRRTTTPLAPAIETLRDACTGCGCRLAASTAEGIVARSCAHASLSRGPSPPPSPR